MSDKTPPRPKPGDRVRLRLVPQLHGTVTADVDAQRVAVRWDNDGFVSAAGVGNVEVITEDRGV
ncbi:hypothetical protein [Amycolatopsis thermoflava]|uniref:hypothetical protein n=1 Tax=Amycolatopsis thermoflava TaxID=84480 RepID=UPI0004259437|nr:hypothetical protein [Amycolatopsis thermoflava]